MTSSIVTADHTSAGAPAKSFITDGVKRTVLPNGLTLLTKEAHDKPVVAAIIWYRVGSRDEELGQTGKSHFLEHMLFKGTDKYKKGDIDLITLKNGGSNNAFTWQDYTAYYFTFASDRWQNALEIEANRMRRTTFAQEEFDPEKKVVEEELHIGLDGPWEALENEVWATAFRQHSYHWPTVGWIEDLEATTAADMKAYYDKWYHPRNATLVIVGDFDTDATVARVKQLFGPIPKGPDPKRQHLTEPEQKGEKRVLVKKATPVERLIIGYHTPAIADADSYTLHVLEALLSTGKTSRLYKRLVEIDQAVTNVRATFDDRIDPALCTIQAEIKPGFKLPAVESAIYDELARIQSHGIAEAEINKAKKMIEADLTLSNEQPLQQAILIGQYETICFGESVPVDSRGYKYLDTYLDRIQAVGEDDIVRVVKKYFVQDNRTVGYLIDDGSNSAPSVNSCDGDDHSGPAARLQTSETSTPAGPRGRGLAFRSGAQKASADPPKSGTASKSKRITARKSAKPSTSRSSKAAGPTLDVERFELPNGLVVLLSENHSNPSVAINALVQAGSRYDAEEKAGLAAFTAEILDEGTKTKTSDQIADAVESVGGRLSTGGDYQSSVVSSSFLSKDIALGLDITADLLMNASFPEDRVRLHLDRRLAQLKSRLDMPKVQASDTFNEIVFKDHPQHRPSIGYEDTVKKLTRSDLLDFYQRYYLPNNTLLSVVGDFDKAVIKQRIEAAFSPWLRDANFKAPAIPLPAPQDKPIDKFVSARKEQVNIFIGSVGIQRKNPDYYALLVFDTILGSSPGFTSRIPRILRDEQGLAYTTFSNMTSSARLDPGRFIAYIGTSPENLDKALAGLHREIARIVHEPVSPAEVEGAKAYLTGSFVFDFQTNGQVGQFLIEAELYDLGFDYLQKYPLRINEVDVARVAEVATKYVHPDRLTTVVVGPVDEHGAIVKEK